MAMICPSCGGNGLTHNGNKCKPCDGTGSVLDVSSTDYMVLKLLKKKNRKLYNSFKSQVQDNRLKTLRD